MSLKWIWLWFYSFNQTSSYFFFVLKKKNWSIFLPVSSTEATSFIPMGAGTRDSSAPARSVQAGGSVNTRKKCAWLMTVCSVSCCVLSSKEGNLSQLQLERLPFQLRPQSFKHWKVKTSHEEKWEEQRLQVSFSFWLSGKDPAVISRWSLACLSQCPPNAPSCQQAC